MQRKDIEVGVEYAVGQADYLRRGRCIEVGYFNKDVYHGHSMRGVSTSIAGAKFEMLDIRDGTPLLTPAEKVETEYLKLTSAQVGDEVQDEDQRWNYSPIGVLIGTQAGGFIVNGQLRSGSTEVRRRTIVQLEQQPITEWFASREIRATWKDHAAAVAARVQRVNDVEQARVALKARAEEVFAAVYGDDHVYLSGGYEGWAPGGHGHRQEVPLSISITPKLLDRLEALLKK